MLCMNASHEIKHEASKRKRQQQTMTSKHAQHVNMRVHTRVILSITGSAHSKHCTHNVYYYVNSFDTFALSHNFLLIVIHLWDQNNTAWFDCYLKVIV